MHVLKETWGMRLALKGMGSRSGDATCLFPSEKKSTLK